MTDPDPSEELVDPLGALERMNDLRWAVHIQTTPLGKWEVTVARPPYREAVTTPPLTSLRQAISLAILTVTGPSAHSAPTEEEPTR